MFAVQRGPVKGRREHAVPSFTATQPQLAARFTAVCVCVCVCVCVGVCLVLPEGCSGDVMNHLNEGQGVRCGSTAVTHTLQTRKASSDSSQDIKKKQKKTVCVGGYFLLIDSSLDALLPVRTASWQTSGVVCSVWPCRCPLCSPR